ncbi:MAG: aldo/keto reductase [Candidatus Sericytochromatia bacterium]
MKQLGKNGPLVSSVGFGCMGMSDFYGSKENRNDKESIETIKFALDSGINFLNTGDFYGMGHNELLVAEAIKDRKEKPFISVKFGALRDPNGAFLGFDARPNAVKNFAAYSLGRLNVEAIDLYQPARVDPNVPIEETVGAVSELIKEGKVKYLGLSEVNSEQLRRAHKVHPVTAVEIEYALATRVIEKDLLKTARELGVSVVAYGVLSRGLLSDNLDFNFKQGDYRAYLPRFTGENFESNKKAIKLLEEIAKEKNCTIPQLAIAWVLHQGNDILPLIATTKKIRLEDNLKALAIKLTEEELKSISDAFPEGTFKGDRYDSHQMQMVLR